MLVFDDLQYAVRSLRKTPGFTAAAVLTLGLGVGANTVIFSVVNSVLLQPLPYKDPSRLVTIWSTQPKAGVRSDVASYPQYLDWKQQNHAFAEVAATAGASINITGVDQAERVLGARVTPEFLSVLGVQPFLGRNFQPEEQQPGKDHVVVFTYDLWERRFGGDPAVIGRPVALNGESYMLIGVLPRGFRYLGMQDAYIPLSPEDKRGHGYLIVVARLKPAASLLQAQAEMDAIARRQAQDYPKFNRDVGVNLVPMHEQMVGNLRPTLLILLGAVSFVLLIACANVANLLLARSSTQKKEMAIRAALGAGRWRLVRQSLVESIFLAGLGGACGLLLGLWGVPLLRVVLPENFLLPPVAESIRIDPWVAAFTLLVSLITGLLFGAVPALEGSKLDLNAALHVSDRTSGTTASTRRMLATLVAAEVAISLVLLIGAGLMLQSVLRLLAVNPGFAPERVLSFSLNLPRASYATAAAKTLVAREILAHLRTLPGVITAGVVTSLPIGGGRDSLSFAIQDRPRADRSAGYQEISPGYFQTMGVPLLAGRDFSERDTGNVTIINEAMARRFWPNENPLGKRIGSGRGDWAEIVGIAGNVLHDGLDRAPRPERYYSYSNQGYPYLSVVIRSAADPKNLISAVRSRISSVDRDLPLSQVRTMQEVLALSVTGRRLQMVLLSSFAMLALLLAAMGIYSVISYSVGQRTQEIGVRMALGAQPRDVMRLVIVQGMLPVVIGLVTGVGGAFALTGVLKSFVFGVTVTEPGTFAAAVLFLGMIGLAASYLPARRATKIDPLQALRYQ